MNNFAIATDNNVVPKQ